MSMIFSAACHQLRSNQCLADISVGRKAVSEKALIIDSFFYPLFFTSDD